MDVLVCIKRVPDIAGTVTLTADGMAVDAQHLGYTVSPHEKCAIELAVRTSRATGGEATVLSLGDGEAVKQLRDALAVGCSSAVLVEADSDRYGPADVAAAVAEVVRSHEAQGRSYGLVLLGNDAADTGDFQVGIRLAYALGRPVLTGASTVEVVGDRVATSAEGPEGREISEAPLPAVVTVMEGGVEPLYPSVPGRMRAKKAQIETRSPGIEPVGSGRRRLMLPAAHPNEVEVLGKDAGAAPAVVDLFEQLGLLR